MFDTASEVNWMEVIYSNNKTRKRGRAGSLKWLRNIVVLLFTVISLYFFIQSSFFAVDVIMVNGVKRLQTAEIVELSGLKKGENIFEADLDQAHQKISLNSMVEGVELKRKLPGKIIIEVQERVPVALIPAAGGFFQVDAEGCVLKKISALDNYPMPIMTGVDLTESIGTGKKIESQKLKIGLNMIAQVNGEVGKMIAEIDVFDLQKLHVYTDQGAEIKLGDASDLQEKFSKVLLVLQEEEKNNKLKEIEYIDVSFAGKPVIYYRKN